ncbi:hypothetical protein TRFO_09799 [Tritrichomonas foetus]|uniref:Uncharacterized protein n=1 Tax=Tritrichomonas foetus TaxID=1144522 RepID=A0A1J4JG77_9EUKA|nr:hypothetical protein TRFO_09799 [Tritrichomonas foetus]|eukprot:OHS96651.1 hypothetical protein TRFO_09799 [Tritrichomonas foetus]
MNCWKTFIARVNSLLDSYYQILIPSSIHVRPCNGHEFEGIFYHLQTKFYLNCDITEFIKIDKEDVYLDDISAEETNSFDIFKLFSNQITNYDSLFEYETFRSKYLSSNGSDITGYQFDFMENKINPTHYSFRTPIFENSRTDKFLHDPKNWETKGSNDLISWEVLDSRTDNSHLNNYDTFHCYE